MRPPTQVPTDKITPPTETIKIHQYIYLSISKRTPQTQRILIFGWWSSLTRAYYKRLIGPVPMVIIATLSLFVRLIPTLVLHLSCTSRLHVHLCAWNIHLLFLPPPFFQLCLQEFLCLQAEVHNGLSRNLPGHRIMHPGNVGIHLLQPHHPHHVF